MTFSRRMAISAAAAALTWRGKTAVADKSPGPICFFSKHLPGLQPRELARALKKVGISGVDLTVRPGGHVLPERVESDLPTAVAAIRAEGLEVPHITTALLTGKDPAAIPILKTAGKLKIPFFRVGHDGYQSEDIHADIKRVAAELASLADLARAHGMQMLYQNHASDFGAALWDLERAIAPLPARDAGIEFDVRHAVVEGGASAWRTGFRLLASRIRAVCIKDFYWKKGPSGWKQENCALGDGMVNFPEYFKLLAKAGFRGPVLMHNEYVPVADQTAMLAAVERDTKYLRTELGRAYT